jgi:hypothetical protein
MTLAEESLILKRKNDCIADKDKTLLSFPGSSVRRVAPPKDDGRMGDGLRYKERSVKAKDVLLSWIASLRSQ